MAPSAASRFRGALLGLAAGDAVGTTVEFRPPGTFAPLTDLVGGGPFGLAPGQWTDDTSLALCLATSLVEVGGFSAADQLERYCRWYEDGYLSSTGTCFDIGGATRAALIGYRRTGALEPPLDQERAANGSIMRLAPVALRYAGNCERALVFAAASSRTTHPATRPVDCCRLLAALLVDALAGVPKEELLAPGRHADLGLHPEVAEIAAGSFRTKAPPAIAGSGYCVRSLEAALWALHTTGTFRDGALAAANLGDDADTTAAVYGQLAGAVEGEEGIPAAWRERLTLRDDIVALADALHAASRLPDHYRVEPHLLAGEYPGDADRERARQRVAALAAHGVTAIVDLTEEGELASYADLVPAGVAHHRRPIRDLGVADDTELAGTLALLDRLLAAGETVYVHCWGGVGRTGTVVACRLVAADRTPEEALARLAELRQMGAKRDRAAPETAEQVAQVRRWAAR